MKKLLALLMALAMVFTFAACGSEDKDDDKKEEKATVASTNADTPAPASPTAAAEKAVEDYLTNFDALTFAALTGDDVSAYGDTEKIGLAVFDGLISNSEFEIISSEAIDDSTVSVYVDLTVPDAVAGFQLLYAEITNLANQYPDADDDEILQLVTDASIDAFADPSVSKETTPCTLTVKLTNGKWTVEPSEELVTILASGLADLGL